MATYEGTAHDDLLTGSTEADLMLGLAGNDTLSGLAGNDSLDGGSGIDSLSGGPGDDTFDGKLEIGDTIEGGSGFDRIVNLDLSWATAGVRIDVGSLVSAYYSDYVHTLWVADIEMYSGVTTGSADDWMLLGFIGDSFVTEYRGGAGTDLLQVDFSGPHASGQHASRVLLSYGAEPYGVLEVRLDDGSWLAPSHVYPDIEVLYLRASAGNDVIYGGMGPDALSGDAGKDRLYGRGGSDTLSGDGGADRLFGGAGDDLLEGGPNGDVIAGGGGFDLAVYANSANRIKVDLVAGTGTAGEAKGDVLDRIEGVVGSLHSDLIVGDSGANALYGAWGADTIRGLGGDDYIEADSGPVFIGTFTLSAETSYFYGGAGNDTIWGATQQRSSVDTGYYQPAVIRGGSGNDEIYNGLIVYAGGGNDYVYGGAIDSTIYGGAGADEVEATYGNHSVYAGDGRDLVWTEALHGGTNSVWLGSGNDLGAVFSYDPAFAHSFDGGTGSDEFFFKCDDLSLTTRVNIDLLLQRDSQIQHIGEISITNFERLTLFLGGEHDDVVKLGNAADFVKSAEGNDYLLGRGGADFLDGGYGADTVFGGTGNDVVIAGSSPDGVTETVHGGPGDDVVYGNFSSADFSGVAELYGDAGRDVFSFLPLGIYTPDRVMDFNPAEDYISIYAGAYYFVDPTSHAFNRIVYESVTDSADELRFVYTGSYGQYDVTRIEVRYDRHSGELSLRDADSDLAEWIAICTVEGAPALDTSHFLTLPELFADETAQLSPSDPGIGERVGEAYYQFAQEAELSVPPSYFDGDGFAN